MIEPRLRFKTDDGSDFPDWEEKILGDVAECLDNKRVPVNAEDRKKRVGTVPYYGAGGIQGYIDEYLFDEELVLLLEDGDAFDDFQVKSIAQYITGKSWVNNHAHVLRAKDNAYFLFASLEHKDIRRWTQLAGASRKKLLKESMLKITIMIPSLPEQQKIADFLSTIDTIIEKQQATVSAWEERKKGVMQKLFSQEVRFKADDGSDFPDWEEKRLGDVFEERTERSVGGEELLSVTISQGVIRQSDSDKRNNSSENKSNYKVVKKNDLAYNTMRMWQGAEGVSDFDGIVSPAYTVVTPLDGNNGKYFEIFFKQISMLHLFQRYSQGLTSDTWNLKFPSFAKIKCCVPCEKEQNKIVNCIVLLDTVIQKQKETLEKWQELKKGLLQQMFV